MIVSGRFWLFLSIAAASAIDAACASAQTAPAPAAAIATSEIVPLYVARTRPLAMLTIGDGAPLPVVFDTGTDENILDSAFAKQAGLKVVGRSPLTDGATGKTTEVPVVATPEPKLSGVALSTRTAQLLDYHVRDEAGIFGPYSFGDSYVVLEGDLNRLRIVPKESGFVPPGPGHAYKNNLPAVDIDVAGHSYEAAVDTGNDSALILGGELVDKVALMAPAKVVAIATSALGEREVLGGTLAGALAVGGYRLEAPEVTFFPTGNGANIGFPVIRHLTIVLDPANKRSWVLNPASEHPAWADFTGQFGPRKITLEGGKLNHQREGRPAFDLKYLGGDLFEMPATGDRIQFFRKAGRVVRLELITIEGDVVPADRTN